MVLFTSITFVVSQVPEQKSDLEKLLPHDTLEAWFFNAAYAKREEAALGGDGGGGGQSSWSSMDESVF